MGAAISRISKIEGRTWLFAIAATFTAWQAIVIGRGSGDGNRQLIELLFWCGALYLLWQKRQRLNLRSDRLSTFLGLFLLAVVFCKSLSAFTFESTFLRLIPLLAPLGLALLAAGWRRIGQFWRELLVVGLLAVPFERIGIWLENDVPFAEATAAVSNFFLHYVGFTTTRNGASLFLPSGSVLVNYACTGGSLIVLMLQLSLLFVLIFPLNWRWQVAMGAFSIVSGFILGCIRVGLLAVIVSSDALFKFWHGTAGNQIFSLIAMLVFGSWCHWVYESVVVPNLEKKQPEPASPLSNDRLAGVPQSPTLLAVTWASVAMVTVYTLLVPTAANRPVKPLNFPERLALTGWESGETEPLRETRPQADAVYNRVRSGQSYRYFQAGIPLELELRYMITTSGDIHSYLRSQGLFPEAGFQHQEIRELPEIGTYKLFADQQQAYLSACINPDGSSTVTAEQFQRNRLVHDLRPHRLLPWLVGRASLPDRRCLWVHLSTPLQGDSRQVSYQRLEKAWQQGYPQWRSLFPDL